MTDRRTSFDLWTVVILLVVMAFQCYAACAFSIYDDEAFSCRRYAMLMGRMLAELRQGAEPDPPLYYVLQNLWVHLFGVSPLALRSLSIVFFAIGLVAIRGAAQAWFDRTTGLVAMILCACHPAHLMFGFAARWYSLMFLCVAWLLWLTARLCERDRRSSGAAIAWAFVAAMTCYTNYFGPVVVLLLWFVGLARVWGRPGAGSRWLFAGLGAVVLYIPWMAPFWRQLAHFPRADAGIHAFVATAAKTGLTLLAGNFASPAAWWAWLPMALCALGLLILLVRRWAVVWPIGLVVLGCFFAGVLSRTMMDKYIMTFSGLVCVLAAALLMYELGAGVSKRTISIAEWTWVVLAVGLVSCCVNFFMQSHWSSLRWLDPFEEVVSALYAESHRDSGELLEEVSPRLLVASHPAARYYAACEDVRHRSDHPKLTAESWLDAVEAQDAIPDFSMQKKLVCVMPSVAAECLADDPSIRQVITLDTAAYLSLPDWDAVTAILDRAWAITGESNYLEDPAAQWKDKLDPTVTHPKWRITVRTWQRTAGS